MSEINLNLEDTWKAISEAINKSNSQTNAIFGQFSTLFDAFIKDSTETTIETNIVEGNQTKVLYRSTIKLMKGGDVTNEFPETRPTEEDVYWKKHWELVEKELATRKDIYMKIIETIGATIKGMINPVSFENIDLSKIVEAIAKPQPS
jgi:hypothetical protein